MENLIFSFNEEYFDSHCIYLRKKKQKLININREFNYNDVVTLVHEFIHYINSSDKGSLNKYLFTEFLSIYFELYATKYLVDVKKISKEKIGYKWRLKNIRMHGDYLLDFSLPFFVYYKLGNIDSKNLEIFGQSYFKISKENYEKECLWLLNELNRIKVKFDFSKTYGDNSIKKELGAEQSKLFNVGYRYILGGILAFYAFENCNIERIIYLNNHINDFDFQQMSFGDVLNFIGININELMQNHDFKYIIDVTKNWNKEVVKCIK